MSAPVTPETLTDEMIHGLHPTAYGAINGKFECTLEEQLDCYKADGTYNCDENERTAARLRICDAINARNGGK